MDINRKIYLKIAAASLSLLAFLLLAPLLLVVLYQDQIKAAVKSAFAANSDQVLDDFSVSLSILQHFPYATFTFRNILIHDTSRHQKTEVFAASRVKLKADLTSLLQKKVVVRGLIIEGSRLYHGVDATGNQKTLRFRDVAGNNEKNFSVQIPTVTIRDMRLKVENHFKGNGISLRVKGADLKLNSQEGILSVTGPVTGTIGHIESRKVVLFRNKPFAADASYSYQVKARTGRLDSISVSMPGAQLMITGQHTGIPDRKGAMIDIICSGYLPTAQVLRELLPVKFQSFFDSADFRSSTRFRYQLSGEMTPTVRPRNHLTFNVKNSRVTWPETSVELRDLAISGVFDNGEGHSPLTSSLTIHKVTARTGKGSLQGQLRLTNFKYPHIEGSLTGNFNLKEWATILRLPGASGYGGEARVKLKVKGPVHRLQDKYLNEQLVWEGDLQLQQAAVQSGKFPVTCTDLNGAVRFASKMLYLEKLTGKAGGYPFRAEATVQHLLPYWFGLSETIALNADIQSEGADAKWFAPADTTIGPKNAFILPEYLQMQAQIRCSRILLPGDTLHNLSVLLQSDREQIRLSDLAFNALTGTVQGSVSMPNNRHQTDDAQVQLTARLRELDLQKPFFSSASGPGKEAASDFRNLVLSKKSKIALFVGSVNLPGEENLKDFVLHLQKTNQRLELTSLQCQTTSGGRITGGGEGIYREGQLLGPKLNLAFAYERLNLQNLIGLFTVISQQKRQLGARTGTTAASRSKAPADYQINLNVTAGQLFYEALSGHQFYLKGALHDDEVQLHYVTMQAFGGKFTSKGNLELQRGASGYPLQLRSQLQDMDLKQVFAAVDMLGLDVLNSRNVSGQADCFVFVRTALDQKFLPGMDRTVMYTQAAIRNMELIEVEAIEKALHFIREKKTSHLYFEDVAIKFMLHNNRFILPGSHMNSNLSHLYLAGTYALEKEAELYFDIAVLDVLFGNNKRRVEKLQNNQELPKPRMVRHLALLREKGQYRLKLYNKQDNQDARKLMENEFTRTLNNQKIDTAFIALPALWDKL